MLVNIDFINLVPTTLNNQKKMCYIVYFKFS